MNRSRDGTRELSLSGLAYRGPVLQFVDIMVSTASYIIVDEARQASRL
jgi:hypothetical protein